ncbi:hypothetical protein ACP275_13G051300 [Erythranthe tilingii]
MIRLEALRLIRNGPTHPAMMRMTEESEQKKEFPSWMRLTSGLEEQDFLPYVELYLYYITLFWNAREISGRLGHVPWREVSSHLIALIVGIYKNMLYIIHIKIFVKLDPDEGWEWRNPSALFFVRK